MNNDLQTRGNSNGSMVTASDAAALRATLKNSLYPGAADASVDMVIAYCKAANLDVMRKPVHIVPMWDAKAGSMRDVVMPGIGLYRTDAARTGCAGVTEPEFGPDVTETIGGVSITFPAWCRVTVKRRQPGGQVDEFTARELWKENYAVKGGKEKSIAPNAMWTKRPYGQLAKCAEAQALRKAFPEIGSAPTADEMEGRTIDAEFETVSTPAPSMMPRAKVETNTNTNNSGGQTTAGDGARKASAPAEATAASEAGKEAGPAAEAAVAQGGEPGPLGDLSPSQCKLVRAKAAAARIHTDAELLAKFPDLSKATINAALKTLGELAAQ